MVIEYFFVMLIRKIILWLVFLALLSGVVFAWNRFLLPCGEPLRYSLGSFHPYFGITEDEFRQEIRAAEQVWEQALGKELFVYDPEALFKVNLIFDQRQLQTLAGQKLEQSLNEIKVEQKTLAEKNAASFELYRKTLKEYEALLVAFQKRLAEYNERVAFWNKQGGAPAEEYEQLQTESGTLKKLEKDLEAKRYDVNALVDTVNQFSKEQVRVVDQHNAKVEGYVRRYGEPKDFDQGDYDGMAMNIYQFDDRAHLRLVLVHELGHALGIGHVEDPYSMMYYKMEQQDPDRLTLTADDRAALLDVCRVSPRNVFRKISGWYALAMK